MRKLKSVVAVVVSAVMLITGVCFLSSNLSEVAASGAVTLVKNTSCVQKFNEIKSYRETQCIAPISPTEGWLFAGWFQDEACKTAISETTKDGAAYAKFVSPDVLMVGCQVSTDTTASSTGETKLRLVTTVDSSAYASVGFIVTGTKSTVRWEGDTVYRTITAEDSTMAYTKTPDVFNQNSQYFYTLSVKNLSKETRYTVTPYWKTLDGTEVNGVTRYVRLSDSWNGYINVPVRLYAKDAAGVVGAGYMEVVVPDGYTFAGVDTYDEGNIFEEMRISCDGNIIKCVGNVKDIETNSNPEGMYLNLRFTTTVAGPTDKLNTFKVQNMDFCTVSEESVETVGAQAVCLNFNEESQ